MSSRAKRKRIRRERVSKINEKKLNELGFNKLSGSPKDKKIYTRWYLDNMEKIRTAQFSGETQRFWPPEFKKMTEEQRLIFGYKSVLQKYKEGEGEYTWNTAIKKWTHSHAMTDPTRIMVENLQTSMPKGDGEAYRELVEKLGCAPLSAEYKYDIRNKQVLLKGKNGIWVRVITPYSFSSKGSIVKSDWGSVDLENGELEKVERENRAELKGIYYDARF